MTEKKKRGTGRGFSYWLRYRIAEYCTRGFMAILPWLPRWFLSALTKVAAQLTFMILADYRRRMEENLAMVMAEEFRTVQERRALARMAWRNFAQGVCETAFAVHASKEQICSTVGIEGEEYLGRALAKKKGVIALSAHLGNFAMIGPRLGAAGYPFSVIVKQPRDQRFARLIDNYRSMKGVHTISARPRREAARHILKALKKNEVVLLVADEFKSGGVEVPFLGCTVPAPRGPVTLALRTGAAVVPMFMTRDQEDLLTLHIGSEMNLIKTGDLRKDVATNVALFVQQLETMVRRYPDQWSWLGFRRNGSTPRMRRRRSKTGTAHQDGRIAS